MRRHDLREPFLEGALAGVMVKCLCRKDKKLYQLLKKNLHAHRNRNLKSAIMFSLCLAFMIFAGTGFQIVVNSIIYEAKTLTGADLYGGSIHGHNYLSD